ncbi:MAG: quinol-cytochrome oxidoreductase complex cytochrome b subunit [Desulforhopalus sp.]|jgi:quinol-cytochrome oxidoreductase complex cytochrome b subunit
MTQATGKTNIFSAFLLHLHPRTVPASTLRFGLSLGLGGIAAILLCVMFVSGLLQLLSYVPQPDSAYSSIQQLYNLGEVGGFVRNVHFWGGNLLVIITFMHLLRVFFTGALDQKRRINWLVGLCLFLLVLFANFTGYLLPWDQLAYWAVTIFTNMLSYVPLVGESLALTFRGGNEVGPSTLHIFFGMHVGLIPLSVLSLLILHFWQVRKAGGLIRRTEGREERVLVVPHLIVREIATACVVLALLFTFAAIVDAPLAEPANPGQSPNPAKAAWYFMGLQELLLHLHPTVAICLIPTLMLVALGAIPFIKGSILPGGYWFGGCRGRRLALVVFLLASCMTFVVIALDEKLLHGAEALQAADLWLNRGVLPLGMLFLLQVSLYLGLKKRMKYSRAEAVMAIFVTNIAIIISLTVIGIWFRGSGMILVNPF